MSYFAGKTFWITGASSGIGEALAFELGKRGAHLILSGRRRDALEAVGGKLGSALVLPFEATDYAALPAVVEAALAWRGDVFGLVNNAGISQRSLALDTGFDVYRSLMEIDFLAPLRLTQLVLPHMVARGSGQIAVVSSIAGKVGTPLRSGYCAAKHACVGYFDALRAEVELAYGINVSVILPGSVHTQVAVNALTGDGSARGRSDPNIEAGMAADDAARRIADGLGQLEREIIVAEGIEAAAAELRRTDPERVFHMTAQEGARLAGLRRGIEGDGALDPAKIRD